MKKVLVSLMMLFSISLFSQQVIDRKLGYTIEDDSVIVLLDTVFYESPAQNVPKYSVNREPVGDTATATTFLFNSVASLLADGLSGMKVASNFRAGLQAFQQVSTAFEQISETTLIKALANQYGNSVSGNYKVRINDGTLFDAVIEKTPAGAMRLRRISDNTAWGVIAMPQSSFRIQNFDPGSGAEHFIMLTIDSSDKPLYRPEVWYVGKGSAFAMRKL